MDAGRQTLKVSSGASHNFIEVHRPDAIFFSKLWEPFLGDHGKWFESRVAESEPVYALPKRVIDYRLGTVFEINDPDLVAEQRLSEICESLHAVGICNDQPLTYHWLEPQIDAPSDELLREMKQYGWTDEHIIQARKSSERANDMSERLKGSVGRLLCSPAFCQRRDDLRELWLKLPSRIRPRLPLLRSPTLSSAGKGIFKRNPPPSKLVGFVKEFDHFCDYWQITGMVAWELPDVKGPKWPANDVSPLQEPPGRLIVETPWHFCLRANDPVGDLVQQDHAQLVEERGVTDLGHWETYARLFEIGFWESVFRNRYGDRKRPKALVTAINAIVGGIIGLESERLLKLRKLRSKLLSGKITSLAGQR